MLLDEHHILDFHIVLKLFLHVYVLIVKFYFQYAQLLIDDLIQLNVIQVD